MELKTLVRKAAVDSGIGGVMALAKKADLSYERTVRVWNGSSDAKLKDVVTVFAALDMEIKFVKRSTK